MAGPLDSSFGSKNPDLSKISTSEEDALSRFQKQLGLDLSSKPKAPAGNMEIYDRPSPWGNSPETPKKESPGSINLPKIEVVNEKDKIQVPKALESPAKVFELKLKNSSGKHGMTDMVVRLPANFDPAKPINLAVYNHGWYSTATTAYKGMNLEEQMANAPPNTVLVVPEWQLYPGSGKTKEGAAPGGLQGNFANKNFFADMLQESFSKIPELQGKKINDLSAIHVFSHSAGYGPTTTIVTNNEKALFSNKIQSITALDSLYSSAGFNTWISENIRDLASGKKQFYNIYNDTSSESQQQAKWVKNLLIQNKLGSEQLLDDTKNKNGVLDSATLAQYAIIFKHSSVKVGTNEPHWAIPMLYVSRVEESLKLRQK